jgi:hypothetical protein
MRYIGAPDSLRNTARGSCAVSENAIGLTGDNARQDAKNTILGEGHFEGSLISYSLLLHNLARNLIINGQHAMWP